MGGFGEVFGWIWGGFWEGFGGLWEARGARMETKMEEIRGHFAILSQDGSRGGFGEDLGRNFGVLAKLLGTIRATYVSGKFGKPNLPLGKNSD